MHDVVNHVSLAGTDASAIVNCLHILARSLDARFSIYCGIFRQEKLFTVVSITFFMALLGQ